MTERFKTGLSGLSRRRFLGTAAAGVAASSLLPSSLRAQQKRGGNFRVAKGHGQTSDTLDPALWENGFMIAMAYGIHGYLTTIGKDGSLEPDLAASWEGSNGARNWRFNLRSGATFHDGRPVTPQDVLASIRYHTKEGSTSVAKPLLDGIESMSIDGNSLVFALAAGNADFPFAFTDYHVVILPATGEDTIDWQSGVGAGAYRLDFFDPGVLARFSRFENDWNSDRGFFETVEMLALVDPNARTSSLVSGDVNAIDRVDLKTVGFLQQNPNIDIHSVAGNQHYTFAMSTNKEPFTDNNVRLALKYAVNREEMIEKILFGYGSPGNDHPIGRGQRFYNDEMPQTSYDPDRARFHLREAGLDGLRVELASADAAFGGAVDAAVLFQASAGAAGITLDVNRVPNDGYWSNVWMTHPFSAVYWGGRPVEDAMLTTGYASGAAWNDTFWENSRFNELLVAARAELDEARRREMYYEMQLILNRDGGAIIPMFANYVFATGPGVVTGDTMASNWDMDGERWMERWSFA